MSTKSNLILRCYFVALRPDTSQTLGSLICLRGFVCLRCIPGLLCLGPCMALAMVPKGQKEGPYELAPS